MMSNGSDKKLLGETGSDNDPSSLMNLIDSEGGLNNNMNLGGMTLKKNKVAPAENTP